MVSPLPNSIEAESASSRGSQLGIESALVAQEMNLEDQYYRAVFSAFWIGAVNVADRSVLVQHLESA